MIMLQAVLNTGVLNYEYSHLFLSVILYFSSCISFYLPSLL
jgi:hypothetical protein